MIDLWSKKSLHLETVSNSDEITIKNIDHLGIVAGIIDQIGIVEIINKKLGIDPREKITSGQVVKALILNGLRMVCDSALYSQDNFQLIKELK